MNINERIRQCGVIAVFTLDDAEKAVPLAKALIGGGIDVMELTLRTPAAMEALKAIRQEVPEMLAGMGTILRPEQVDECQSAGAAFGVAPGINPNVVKRAKEAKFPFAPGVANPTNIEAALELGCGTLKFFPAEDSGGINYLETIAAPYEHLGVRYIPLGSVRPQNLGPYLKSPHVLAVGGSWIAPQEKIENQQWDWIKGTAQEAKKMVHSIRGE